MGNTIKRNNHSSILNFSTSSLNSKKSSFDHYHSEKNLSLSRTNWPLPSVNSVFISHFKRTSKSKDYDIINEIASGAFGTVYRVSDNQNNSNEFALKILKKTKIIEGNSIDQIKNEVAIQKICGHHPLIVQQIDTWQDKQNLYILSEFICGGELFNTICHFSFDLVRFYVAEIALALDFLHNGGIIYRDIKPENIILTINYHIKLVDFGLSKWLKLGERTRTICGTFQYMAPEILSGEPYGHAVDWWSFGVVICKMLTNKFPNLKNIYKSDSSTNNEDVSQSTEISQSILPIEIEDIPFAYEGKDILRRLLVYDSKVRLKSVLELQKIAMFKNFKINLDYLQQLKPQEIVAKCHCRMNSFE